jgi:hypothetical protein
MTLVRDEQVTPDGKTVREWDPDVDAAATVTVYDSGGKVVSTRQVDVSAERQAVLAERAERADKATAKEAFARLDQIIDADPTNVTNRQVVAAVQDIARMVRALGRRELAD